MRGLGLEKLAERLDLEVEYSCLRIKECEITSTIFSAQNWVVKNGEKKSSGTLPDLFDKHQKYRFWVELAQELVNIGEIQKASGLLALTKRIANIYKDFSRLAEIDLIESQISKFEGKIENAIESQMKAYKGIN